jgi:uncharacterized protein
VSSTPSALLDRRFELESSAGPQAVSRVAARVVWRRHLTKATRWLHIYGSMFSLAVVLFFSVTGIMLNHPNWFAGAERLAESTGQMNTAWIAAPAEGVDRLSVVEFLRATHRVTGAVSDFRVEGPDVSVAFKGPGYVADALIDRANGTYTLTETRLGLAAIVGDLHKGRDSGRAWAIVIDASAALLCFVSLSGLVLLYFLQKHRSAGVLLVVIGGLVTYGVYATMVP